MNKIGIVILSLLLSMSIVGKCSADSVMIDPGHGGSDSGAISYDNTLEEKDLNLDTALAVIEELKKHGVTVYATRTDDTYVSLQNRSRMANKITDLDLFVSIHHNACESPSVNRGEVIYSVKEKESQRLAECIGKKMKQIGDMEIKIYNRYNARGTDYYSVLRNTKATSVIVEISFITSEEGVALVDTPEERKQNGILVAQGIMDYFGIDYTKHDITEQTIPKLNNDVVNDKDKTEVKVKTGIDLINSILRRNSKRNAVLDKLLSMLK